MPGQHRQPHRKRLRRQQERKELKQKMAEVNRVNRHPLNRKALEHLKEVVPVKEMPVGQLFLLSLMEWRLLQATSPEKERELGGMHRIQGLQMKISEMTLNWTPNQILKYLTMTVDGQDKLPTENQLMTAKNPTMAANRMLQELEDQMGSDPEEMWEANPHHGWTTVG